MSLQLIFILMVLMAANQIIGTGYGSWKSGFDSDLFFKGVKKLLNEPTKTEFLAAPKTPGEPKNPEQPQEEARIEQST